MRRLQSFTGRGYDKGRSKAWQALWFATENLVFSAWWCPGWLRPKILRAFGADIGERVFIRHKVRVHWPWKLTIDDDTWIGEGVWLLNLEPIHVGSNVCLSQDAFLCTGSHDHHDPDFEYDNGPIVIEDGAWVAARAVVSRGVTIGEGAVVRANHVASKDILTNTSFPTPVDLAGAREEA